MFEYHIDFKGQCLAEQITQGVISAFGVLGFLVGFFLQDIRLSLYVFTAGIVLAGLLVIPAWPYLNKSSIQWLPSREKAAAAVVAAAATAQQESSKAGKEKST
ncbi:hypothetical protein BGZ68_004860 [Mortierella alpina]|nr:hypothetical protein BGZ68_004860 [Mortierella alpina]